MCGHSPGEVATESSAKLAVQGYPVLIESGVDQKGVSGCVTPDTTDSNGVVNFKKCNKVASVTDGRSTKLQAGGAPVLMDTLKGTTDGMVNYLTPQTLLKGVPIQNKLKAV